METGWFVALCCAFTASEAHYRWYKKDGATYDLFQCILGGVIMFMCLAILVGAL